MNNEKRFDVYHILSLLFLSVFPIIIIVSGIGLVKSGILLTVSFILSYFLFPLIAILLFSIILFKAKKTRVKVAVCIFVLIVFSLLFLSFYMFQDYEFINCYENEELQKHYSENTNVLMPELSGLSNPEKTEYYHYEGFEFIFEWESKALVCKYSEPEYLLQKSSLDRKYVFIIDDRTNQERTTDIDGYSFRMLSTDEYDMNYPKDVTLIATNDETKEIVYLSFHDQDIDYIDSMDKFILDDCGWKHIR